ncbi:hypothetical protein ACLMJK_008844 [Lecanora helva]
METAIRWSNSSTLSEQHFLIADVKDRFFKRCRVEAYDGNVVKHETISTHNKVPGFRAFDWAPHDENLVAVGSWSGEVTLIRIDNSSPIVSLPAKRQRLCNAVAFSRTGLLAAGLEGIRNDFCLNIWDANQKLPVVSSPGGSSKPFVEPYRRFASSEAISSIKFFSGQPEVFVAGIKGKGIRIYDLRENTGNPSLAFKTDSVFNLAIDPLDENYFACAGVPDDSSIQIWDCRLGAPYSTAMVGSTSDLGLQAEKPVLKYENVFTSGKSAVKKFDGSGTMVSTIWSLRYCKGKSGCLGALSSTGDFKVFETKHAYSSAVEMGKARDNMDFSAPSTGGVSMLTKQIHHIEHACDDPLNGRPEKDRIVAFDFTNLAGRRGTPTVIALRGDHTVGIVELKGAPSALGVSSLGDVAVSRPYNTTPGLHKLQDEKYFLSASIQRYKPSEESSTAALIAEFRGNRSGIHSLVMRKRTKVRGRPLSSRELHEQLLQMGGPISEFNVQEALALSTVTRQRCVEGYLLDSKRNKEILRDDPWLQRLWKWIERSMTAAEADGMATDTLDLSFFGVASIWNNDLDSQRASSKSSKPTYSKEVADAVAILCERLCLPEFRMLDTGAPKHRQLCLYTCGLGLRHENLEKLVRDLVQQGENTKAAAIALIHDEAKLARFALKNGNASPAHRELSLALAGYNKGINDETWEETVRDLAEQLEDPYARAILALVRYGDWHDVLAETNLPLRDRLGVALMYLDDAELTEYIDSNVKECIETGDIEGVVLTGLTELAVPLFEKYIRRFKDLQTAVLAMSIACPRCFSDPQVALWQATYRSFLNRWQMFIERSRFDVQSTKLSAPPGGLPEVQPASRQEEWLPGRQSWSHWTDSSPTAGPVGTCLMADMLRNGFKAMKYVRYRTVIATV